MHFIPLKKNQVTTANVLPLLLLQICTYFLFKLCKFCWRGAQEHFLPQGAGYPSCATGPRTQQKRTCRTIIGLLAYNWCMFSIDWLFFQSVSLYSRLQAIHKLHQRSHCFRFFFFFFFHIASWFNHKPNSCHGATNTKHSSVHRCLVKSVANWRVLSNFILVHFSNFSATKAN